MAVHQHSASLVCQKEHRTFYAPFTRGGEQVQINFVATNVLNEAQCVLNTQYPGLYTVYSMNKSSISYIITN